MKLFAITFVCGLVAVSEAKPVRFGACALKNCALKSPLATEGPGFQDGVHFFATESMGKDTRASCPFGDDNDPEPSKKEYMKYMKELDKVSKMPPDERRAYALKHEQEMIDAHDATPKAPEKPSIDVAKAGVEAVSSKTLDQLRAYNEYDLLVTFYAPWCPHCKNFVTAAEAPINALDEALERVKGPKVVKFDINESSPPGQLQIDSVPTVYLFKKSGEAIEYEGDVADAKSLMAFAMDKPAPVALVAKDIKKHLRTKSA